MLFRAHTLFPNYGESVFQNAHRLKRVQSPLDQGRFLEKQYCR